MFKINYLSLKQHYKMGIDCINHIVFDEIAINIDLTKTESWDLNNQYVIYSLNNHNKSIVKNIELLDFGLTGIDFGYSERMEDSKTIETNELFSLKNVKYVEVSNPTDYEYNQYDTTIIDNDYAVEPILTGDTGRFIKLNGGYFNGFFKLHGYDVEYLPSRFNNGITIETMLIIDNSTSGIFYYMGVRSEDKYSPYFTGEIQTDSNNSIIDGVFTSEDNYLSAINEESVRNSAYKSKDDEFSIIRTESNNIENLKNNIICFGIENKKIYVKYVDDNLNIINQTSTKIINNVGSTLITITFTPNFTFTDKNINCKERRVGELRFYVNGRFFWNIIDFPEFYFHPIANDKEKQIGIPYNISWGGGSFGLKHSWHFDEIYHKIFNSDFPYSIYVFTFGEYNFDSVCNKKFTNTNEWSNQIISKAGFDYDECGDKTYYNILQINYNVNNQYRSDYFLHALTEPIFLLQNQIYEFTVIFNQNNLINWEDNPKIYLTLLSINDDIEILDKTIITNELTSEWGELKCKVKTKNYESVSEVFVGIVVETDTGFIDNGVFNIKNYQYHSRDILSVDSNKNNLFVEKNFGDSETFNGGIQKLRIYLKPLSINEIKHNAKFEFNGIPNKITEGGRLIFI